MTDELRDRFRDLQSDEEEADGEDDAGSSDAPPTTHNTQTSDGSGSPDRPGSSASAPDSPRSDGSEDSSSSSSSVNVRDRPQMSMYLPPDVKSRVEDDYEKLDAKSKLADQGGLQKNDDFFVGMIEFALEEKRDEFEEYIGVSEDE